MISFLLGLSTLFLVVLCLFIILVILMQRPSANAGMGASLGGGAAEAAFGAESTTILNRWTIYMVVAFFVLSFGLYLINIGSLGRGNKTEKGLPAMIVPASLESKQNDFIPGSLTETPKDTQK